MEFLVALVIFGAILCFLLALGTNDVGMMRTRLETLRGQPGVVDIPAEASPTVIERLIAPVAKAPVQQMRRIMPVKLLEGIEKKLIIAGEPMTMNSFLMFQLVSAGAFLFLPLLLVISGMVPFSLIALGVVVGLAALGIYIPHFWLRQRVGNRQGVIIKSLPDAFDLITTCVEAGLGLDAALSRVAEKVEGPFAEELRRALREISLGKQRQEALRELGERTGVPDLIAFVNAVVQAELMGSSVGAVLRVQADQLRVRRRQRAEEQAYKAPVKMIFPLVLCIFPTLFIVILGPAAITIMQDFPGG